MYDAIHTAVAARAVQAVEYCQWTEIRHRTTSTATSQAWVTEAVRVVETLHAKFTLRNQEWLCPAGGAVSESALLYPAYDCDNAAQQTRAYQQDVL